jgi:hypothetical protein
MSDPRSLFEFPLREIPTRILRARAVVVVATGGESSWVKAECEFAESNGLQVFQVVNLTEIDAVILQIQKANRDAPFFDLNNRFSDLDKSFGDLMVPGKDVLDVYEQANQEDSFVSVSGLMGFLAFISAVIMAIITYFVHP